MAIQSSSTLRSAVTSLQQLLTDSAQGGAASADAVRERAAAADFPYPELAAQVFTFLQSKRVLSQGLTTENISDAFMSLLLHGDASAALGGGKVNNPWLNVRAVLRNTGMSLGTSLLDVYHTVRATGLGYAPTLLEVSTQLRELLGAVGNRDAAALKSLSDARGLPAWMTALAAAWMRRRKGAGDLPTDADLEEMLADEELLRELRATPGPWDVYARQGEALRMLRHFGEALSDLDEELSP